MNIGSNTRERAAAPVQDLPETMGFSPRMKDGVAGKIKGRGTPGGRWRCLHGGWRGTHFCAMRAAILLKAASRLARRRAVYDSVRLTTPERLA